MGNSPSRRNRNLEKAIQARKVKRVKKWLKRGADPNGYSKKSNYSFLSMAITLREEPVVAMLLRYGANPDQKSWLANDNKEQLQRRLSSNDDEYPIHIAASHGHKKIMEALLNSTIDVNIGQDHKLGTALHQAARFGHSKLAELLLASGADIIAIDSRLNIPLHIAATFGQTKVAEVLLRYGSPIDTTNMKSWTPLHYASSEGAVSMVKLLLRHGATADIKDGTGDSPMDLVKTEDILRVFLEHAIQNPDGENVKIPNGRYIDQSDWDTVPPKPVRTFTYSNRTQNSNTTPREKTQSEDAESIGEGRNSTRLQHSKSYSDFGKWKRRKDKAIQSKDNIAHDDVSIWRRVKSVPASKRLKRNREKIDKALAEKSKTRHDLQQDSEVTPSDHRKTYSARYSKPNGIRENQKSKEVKNLLQHQDILHRHTKSMSSVQKSVLTEPLDSEYKNRTDHEREKNNVEVATSSSKNVEDYTSPVRYSLSRSLHNLTMISDDADNDYVRDNNFNYSPKPTNKTNTKPNIGNQQIKPINRAWIEGQVPCELNSR